MLDLSPFFTGSVKLRSIPLNSTPEIINALNNSATGNYSFDDQSLESEAIYGINSTNAPLPISLTIYRSGDRTVKCSLFSSRLGSAKQNPTINNPGYDGAMQYRRAKNPGSSYFFTLVTHNRRPILCVPENIVLLRDSFKQVLVRHPFVIEAIANSSRSSSLIGRD
jgi:hypothetical protein